MLNLYRAICSRLDTLDFEKLWPGFHVYPFALYNQSDAVIAGESFPTPEGFYGNTTILYKGRQIAIWNIGTSYIDDTDRLTSSMTHEMFHAFQYEHEESRFPSDLTLFSEGVTAETLALKIRERRILASGGAFAEFCAARIARKAGGKAHQDELVETAEGMAQFIEYRALEQLSQSAAESTLTYCRERLKQPEQAADIRRSGYDTGTYMLRRADEFGLNIYHNIGQDKRSVFEFLETQVKDIPENAPLTAEELGIAERLLSEQHKNQKAEMDAFYQAGYDRKEGSFTICGYDPMNMWRQGDIMYSHGFIALSDSDGKLITIKGKALFDMEQGSANKVTGYMIPLK